MSSDAGATEGPGAGEVFVGAFGAHRAWGGEIDGLGTGAGRLDEVRRVVYSEGFAPVIGRSPHAGGAQPPDPAHVVLWRSRETVVVARVWSTRADDDARAEMMGVAVECRRSTVAWVLSEALPRLVRLERRCRGAASRQQVQAALEATRQELRARASVGTPDAPCAGAIADAARLLATSGDRERFYRLMRVLVGDAAARADADSDTPGGFPPPEAPLHLRVPAGPGSSAVVLGRWMRFTLAFVDPAASVTLVRRTEADIPQAAWVDILLGASEGPTPEQFGCTLLSEEALPLATEASIGIDPAFAARCDRLIDEAASIPDPPPPVEDAPVPQAGCDRPGAVQPGRCTKRALNIAGVLAVVVLAALGVHWYGRPAGADAQASPEPARLSWRETDAGQRWARLCGEYDDWFAEFRRALAERPDARRATRDELYAGDAYLAALLARLNAAPCDPWTIAGVAPDRRLADLGADPPASVRTPEADARIRASLEIVDALGSRLASDWPAARSMMAAARAMEESGLCCAASDLRAGVAALGVRPGSEHAEAIDRVFTEAPVVSSIWYALEAGGASAALATSSGDPLLARFADWWRGQVQRNAEDHGSLASLRELSRELREPAMVARRLREFLEHSWGTTDRELLAREVAAASLNVGEPGRDDFLDWLEIAARCRREDAALDPRRTSEVPADLARAGAALDRRRHEGREPVDGPLIADYHAAASALARLRSVACDSSTKAALGARVDGLALDVLDLLQRIENADVADAAAAAGTGARALLTQRAISARSGAINAAWRRRRDHAGASVAGPPSSLARARAVLIELDTSMPRGVDAASPSGVGAAVVGAATVMRERAISAVIERWGEGEPDAASIAEAASELRARFDQLRNLADVATRLEARLDRLEPLDGRGDANESIASLAARCRSSGVLGIDRVSAALQPMFERVDALVRIGDERSDAELVWAAKADDPGLAMAAWRRLTEAARTGWPSSLDDLEDVPLIADRLMEAAVSCPRGVREVLTLEISKGRAACWSRVFARLREPLEIEYAAAMAGEFGVQPGDLPAPLCFNLALARLKSAVAATESAADVPSLIDRFELEAETGSNEAGRIVDLARQMIAEHGAGPRMVAAGLGPAAAGWRELPRAGQRRFVGPRADVPIDFVLIDEPGVPTFYICTTELSLAQWCAIVEQAHAWVGVASLFSCGPGTPDTRNGPRVWSWRNSSPAAPGMCPAATWLRDVAAGRRAPESPRTLAPAPPSGASPMNDVPPSAAIYVAGLAGCRLPTLDEWNAAILRSRVTGGSQHVNLRDRTWQIEQSYLRALEESGPVRWPDEEAFVPGVLRGSAAGAVVGRDAPSNAWDDHVLWFAPVDRAETRPPFHLIGNVAELVIDAKPGMVDAQGPMRSPAEAVAACERLGSTLRIIGGSALSPAAFDPCSPQPVDVSAASNGYTDVGVRLAFSAPGAGTTEPLPVRLREALRAVPYIYPHPR